MTSVAQQMAACDMRLVSRPNPIQVGIYTIRHILKHLIIIITNVRNVDEARGVCKGRSRWFSVVSAYPHEKKA